MQREIDHLWKMNAIHKIPGSSSKEKWKKTSLEKAISHIIVEIIEYIPNAVAIKTIIEKSTQNVSVMAFDHGQGLCESASPFDKYAQIIEGNPEIVIDNLSFILQTGQGVIIPAHSKNHINPNGRFKMILTIIKDEC